VEEEGLLQEAAVLFLSAWSFTFLPLFYWWGFASYSLRTDASFKGV
jgi:hypothetical protein